MVQEIAQTYEQPDAVVRWHYEKPERLAEFEALAVEHNVVDWVLGKAQVDGRADDVRGADGAGARPDAVVAASTRLRGRLDARRLAVPSCGSRGGGAASSLYPTTDRTHPSGPPRDVSNRGTCKH